MNIVLFIFYLINSLFLICNNQNLICVPTQNIDKYQLTNVRCLLTVGCDGIMVGRRCVKPYEETDTGVVGGGGSGVTGLSLERARARCRNFGGKKINKIMLPPFFVSYMMFWQ